MSDLLANVNAQVRCLHIISAVDVLPKGHVRLETELLYPDRTSVELYLVKPRENQTGFVLTDFGQTISWLINVQIRPWLSKTRKKLVEDAIRTFGVTQHEGSLQLRIESLDQLTEAVFKLGQACARVADISFTKRMIIQSTFSEDLEEVISDLELVYDTNQKFIGKYNKLVEVDYYVQGKTQSSMVLGLSASNASQAHAAANEIFTKWFDLSDPGFQEQKVTIFDDRRNAYRDEDLERLSEVSILLPYSSNRDIRALLAA